MLPPVTHLINNNSLKEGIFPDLIKIAVIVPVHKKGNTQDINNYRQISLLFETSKILERVVYNIVTYNLSLFLFYLFIYSFQNPTASANYRVALHA
nr:unnamed protein product [Callosobruchus chinensis]